MCEGAFPFPEFVIFMILGDIPLTLPSELDTSLPPPPLVTLLKSVQPQVPSPWVGPPLSNGVRPPRRPVVALLLLERSDPAAASLWGPWFQQGQDSRVGGRTQRPEVQDSLRVALLGARAPKYMRGEQTRRLHPTDRSRGRAGAGVGPLAFLPRRPRWGSLPSADFRASPWRGVGGSAGPGELRVLPRHVEAGQ